MIKAQLLLLLFSFSFSCFADSKQNNWEEKQSLGRFFQETNVTGCFLLYDLNENKYIGYNFKRASTPFLPASTYKIFNSLIALETGVVRDENDIIKWDGVDRGSREWNKDLSMKDAFKYSAAWFYQEMARRIGKERMQHYLNRAGYGNRNIQGGIDQFWFDGELRITPKEQIEMLVKLYRNELPFSPRTMNIVKDIMVEEKIPEYVLHAKTGWAATTKPQIGWWVGYVEKGKNVYFFATNIDINKDEDGKARKSVTKNILRELAIVN